MTITEALKRFRKKYNLSQKDIADILDVTPQNVYRLEKVNSAISAEAVVKLADAFNISADYLLGRSDDDTSDKTAKEICKAVSEFEEKLNSINRPSVRTL